MKHSILFLSTLNLASNPRLVKEIDLALSCNFSVTVICFEFENWSKNLNDQLLHKYNMVNFIIISAGRKPVLPWLKSVIKEKFYRIISKIVSLPVRQLSQAVSRRSDLLIDAFNKSKLDKIDLVIGHNPGALYPALYASKKIKSKLCFDVEDYHPGEGNNLRLQLLTIELMKKTLSRFDYISYSSESIYKECMRKINGIMEKKSLVINNTFSSIDFSFDNSSKDEKLQLVWFSQNIDKNRGLEKIIPIIDKYSNYLSLTLFGNAIFEFKDLFSKYKGIKWAGSISQDSLHHQLSRFDIGLALEPGKDLNNELALSNKLCAYFQAGLYIIATDTIEQKRFIEYNPEIGMVINKDFKNFESVLLGLLENITEIRNNHIKIRQYNRNFSWEKQSMILKEQWISLLTQ